MTEFLLTLLAALLIFNAWEFGWSSGYKAAGREEEPFPEPGPEDVDDDDDEEDEEEYDAESVCLRVGMTVVCKLTQDTHTHGVLVGFAPEASGAMLAVVNVGNAPYLPIDVDKVEPASAEGRSGGYRDNADPKQWN